jgi:hypothetical protein
MRRRVGEQRPTPERLVVGVRDHDEQAHLPLPILARIHETAA